MTLKYSGSVRQVLQNTIIISGTTLKETFEHTSE